MNEYVKLAKVIDFRTWMLLGNALTLAFELGGEEIFPFFKTISISDADSVA